MIAPSILNADSLKLQDEIQKAVDVGITRFHLDIMDGHFVPNLSFGPELLRDFKKHFPNLEAEIHLMSDKPNIFVPEFIKAGADIIELHYEAMNETQLKTWIEYAHQNKTKVALVLNPDTDTEKVHKFLPTVDQILLMTVFPGFGGQKFITAVADKVRQLKRYMTDLNLDIPIEVDGGIDDKTAKIAHEAGADIFVVGSFIFSHKDVPTQIKKIEKSIK